MTSTQPLYDRPDHTSELALRLANAENALLTLTSGQVDAIVDPLGRTYLLRPAQEHLRHAERRLQTVIDSVADVITVVNRGGTILSQNMASERVLGYLPEDLVGNSLFALVHDDDLPPLYQAFFHVAEGISETATAEFRHRDCSGQYRWVEATVAQMQGPHSGTVVLSLRPAGLRLRGASERLRDSALTMLKAQSSVSAPLPVDIDPVPVTAGYGSAPVPAEASCAVDFPPGDYDSEVAPEFADAPPNSRVRLETIAAHDEIRFVMETLSTHLTAAHLDVILHLRASQCTVYADWARLLQVMCSLVKNAAACALPGSTISIETSNDSTRMWTMTLRHGGAGLEVGTSSAHPEAGPKSGAGPSAQERTTLDVLQVARRLTEAQGGTLTFKSDGRWAGLVYRVHLLTGPQQDRSTAITLPEEPRDPPLTILVGTEGDDGSLVTLLTRCGHHAFPAPDTSTALALGENCRFDLAIIWVAQPSGHGYDLMRRLQATRPLLAAISVGGGTTPDEVEASRNSGFREHLPAGATRDQLRSAIMAAGVLA